MGGEESGAEKVNALFGPFQRICNGLPQCLSTRYVLCLIRVMHFGFEQFRQRTAPHQVVSMAQFNTLTKQCIFSSWARSEATIVPAEQIQVCEDCVPPGGHACCH
jgi:hypothetical protein